MFASPIDASTLLLTTFVIIEPLTPAVPPPARSNVICQFLRAS